MSRTASTHNPVSYDTLFMDILENDDSIKLKCLTEEDMTLLQQQFYNLSLSTYVCMSGKYNILKYLIENQHFCPDDNILSLVCELYVNDDNSNIVDKENYKEIIRLLFDFKFYFDENMNYDWGFLYLEAEEKMLNIDLNQHIKMLVSTYGIDLNICDSNGHMPFFEACFYSNPELVEAMLLNGAKLEVHTKNSEATPLSMAITGKRLRNVNYLLNKYGSISALKNEKSDLLGIAALKNDEEILFELIRFGFSVEKSEALAIAAKQGYCNIANILINEGADPNKLSITGYLPIEFAINSRHYEMIKFLIKSGSDIYRLNKKGISPFKKAIRDQNSDFFKALNDTIENNSEKKNDLNNTGFIHIEITCI